MCVFYACVLGEEGDFLDTLGDENQDAPKGRWTKDNQRPSKLKTNTAVKGFVAVVAASFWKKESL